MKMTIQYDRTHVKTPRLRGFALRMVLILLERRWIATLLAPLLTRGLGIKEFRATQAHEPLTFLAIHRCEVCDAAPKQTLNDVPRLKHVGSGFQFTGNLSALWRIPFSIALFMQISIAVEFFEQGKAWRRTFSADFWQQFVPILVNPLAALRSNDVLLRGYIVSGIIRPTFGEEFQN